MMFSWMKRNYWINGESNGTCDNDVLNDLHARLKEEAINCDKYAKLNAPQVSNNVHFLDHVKINFIST